MMTIVVSACISGESTEPIEIVNHSSVPIRIRGEMEVSSITLPHEPLGDAILAYEGGCGSIEAESTGTCRLLSGTIRRADKPDKILLFTAFGKSDSPEIIWQLVTTWDEIEEAGRVIIVDDQR